MIATYEDPSGEGVRGATVREIVEGDLGGGVLGLAEGGEIVGALEGLAVEVDRRLEARRVVRTFPDTRVRWEVEAAPLRQLLELVLVHLQPPSVLPLPREKIVEGDVGDACISVSV